MRIIRKPAMTLRFRPLATRPSVEYRNRVNNGGLAVAAPRPVLLTSLPNSPPQLHRSLFAAPCLLPVPMQPWPR
jgi:hypothetical protein